MFASKYKKLTTMAVKNAKYSNSTWHVEMGNVRVFHGLAPALHPHGNKANLDRSHERGLANRATCSPNKMQKICLTLSFSPESVSLALFGVDKYSPISNLLMTL
jgi:hypothetical protein